MNVEGLTRLLETHGYTTSLREGGTELSVECPLCMDEQDRLYINTNTGLWICFHCHSRGNLVQLGVDLLEMSEREAIETSISLRGPEGRDVPHQAPALPPKIDEGVPLPEGFIRENGEGMAGTYLKGRGLSRALVPRYGIGYVLNGYYAGRVVVPVVTEGAVRTWVARDWTGLAPKKALMPKDSQAGRALFNYDFLPNVEQGEGVVAVVEGVFDALRMVELEHKHVVATLGAHVTGAQRRLLKRKGYTRVVLIRDGDKAGRDAAIEEARELHAARFDVKIANLPDGVDPGNVDPIVLAQALLDAKPVVAEEGIEALREVHHG